MAWTNLEEDIADEFSELEDRRLDYLAQYLAHHEHKRRAYRKEYDARPENKAKRDARYAKWYAAQPDKRREYGRRYYSQPHIRAKQTARQRKLHARNQVALYFARWLSGTKPGKPGRPRKNRT